MEYFLSHIGVLFIGALIVAGAALLWWFLTEKNAQLIRQRAEARKKEALEKNKNSGSNSAK